MGPHEKFTVPQIEAALRATHGQITLAADNLGCAYNTVRRYVDKSPTLQGIIVHYRERRVDTAELKLENAINNGEPWAITLTLKTVGKDRGYTERHEHTGPDGGPIKTENTTRVDLSQLTEDELAILEAAVARQAEERTVEPS